jgi:predicted DNA-binding protein (UPF0251 family)
MTDYLKETERLLDSRKGLAASVKNMERRIGQLAMRRLPSGTKAVSTENGRPAGRSPYSPGTLKESTGIVELKRRMRETRRELREIERVIKQLGGEESEVLRLWYVECLTKDEIAAKMGYAARDKIYRLKNAAIKNFSIHWYGVDALRALQGF